MGVMVGQNAQGGGGGGDGGTKCLRWGGWCWSKLPVAGGGGRSSETECVWG